MSLLKPNGNKKNDKSSLLRMNHSPVEGRHNAHPLFRRQCSRPEEEDRYAPFIDVGGIKTPFIVDRFTNGNQTSRINYQTVEFNKTIPDAIFAKPSGPKEVTELKPQ